MERENQIDCYNQNYDKVKLCPEEKRGKRRILIVGLCIGLFNGILSGYSDNDLLLVLKTLLLYTYSFVIYRWVLIDSEKFDIVFSSAQKKAFVLLSLIMVVWYSIKTRKRKALALMVKIIAYGILIILSTIIGSIVIQKIG